MKLSMADRSRSVMVANAVEGMPKMLVLSGRTPWRTIASISLGLNSSMARVRLGATMRPAYQDSKNTMPSMSAPWQPWKQPKTCARRSPRSMTSGLEDNRMPRDSAT